jgi:16S rRNA (guanine527-N7)-methyltransferase
MTRTAAATTAMTPVPDAEAALSAYRKLLERYHRTLDLLSPAGYADIERHLAEAERYAAAIAELAPGGSPVVDLGSGAGLPGVVVAARLAPREVWWVERRRRRATFLTQVAAHAGLASVRLFEEDVRRLARPSDGIAAVTAQAVGTLAEVAALTLPLWGSRVLLVSRKGPDWPGEVESLAVWLRGVGRTADGAWAEPRVLRAEALGTRGTLVAVEVLGG